MLPTPVCLPQQSTGTFPRQLRAGELGDSYCRVTLHYGLEDAYATKGLPTVRGRFHGQALSLATGRWHGTGRLVGHDCVLRWKIRSRNARGWLPHRADCYRTEHEPDSGIALTYQFDNVVST